MAKIVVLGGYGEMGRVIVTDLVDTFRGEIVLAGRNKEKAESFAMSLKAKNVTAFVADADNDAQMKALLKGTSVLINATNYYSNIKIMRSALKNGVNYLDLGGLYWLTKQQLKLHNKFKKKKIVAILGCGSTPGITNIMAEYGAKRFDSIRSLDIAFADKDYTQYNQPFVVPYSMQTVFDEFTKAPPIMEKGRIMFEKPLTKIRHIDFPKPVGRIACRLSIHSEVATIPKTFHEKGIRECGFWGGWDEDFVRKAKFLIDAGFASEKPMTLGRKEVVPRLVAVALLNRFMPPTKTKINDMEFLRVEIKGRKNGKDKKLVVYCQAFTEKRHNIPAGSWDTGVPPSIIAQEIAKGQISAKGVMAPERCISPKLFFKALKRRNMKVFTRSR